MDLASLPNP